MTPKVTVIIPMYNRADYIGAAIDSILAQTYDDYEIIVVDDASTDGSRERVLAYRNDRVHLVCNHYNRGESASRNHGIAQARGQYVALLDSDDCATTDRLERQVAFLDAHPDHAAVGAWMRWIDADGKETGEIKRKAVSWDQVHAETLFRSCLEVSATTARTDILRAYPHRETFIRAADYDLWARIVFDYKLATLPRILLRRRRHSGQTTIAAHDPEMERCCLEVIAGQVERLGMSYDAEDLKRHYILRRMHKTEFWPDLAYLEWSERWLSGLQAANRRRALYPEPAFSGVLSMFWAKACWRALRKTRFGAFRHFARSPLRPTVWRGVHAELWTRLHPAA